VTLCAAVALLNIFYGVIGNDLSLHSAGKEAAIAGVAALVEGGGVWLVLHYVPTATRALVVPAIIVALIYKVGHYEDWNTGDVLFLLFFQVGIGSIGVCLFGGHFQTAFFLLVVFGILLAVIAFFTRSL
jgi:hypothetical protein